MKEPIVEEIIPSELSTEERAACLNWFAKLSVADQERLMDTAIGAETYSLLTLYLYADVVKDAQNFMSRSWESMEDAQEAARRSARLKRQVHQMRQNKRFITEEMMIRHHYFEIIEIYVAAKYSWPQIVLHLKADLRINTSAAYLKRIFEDERARRNVRNEYES